MSKRISVQWRITILTALLIAAACVSLNLLLFYSGSGSMDALNGFVVEYKTENQREMTIQIPKENMQAFFSDFSQQVNEEKVRFERIGWYITALVTLLSAIIAYFFSGKALKPLKDFAQQTEQINEESLTDTRLPEDTTAEFRQLSESVNGMLDRLAQAFDAQRQFTGNAAHELRTPLALMQTRLELFAAEHQQMSEETAKLLHFQQEQVERLSALVRTLLEMSDLRSVPRTDRIDLAPMVEEVLVDLTPLAQKNGITLTQAGENVQLVGSDVLLYRLLFNLTENAIKYNRTGGSVSSGKAVRRQSACGIPARALPRSTETASFSRFSAWISRAAAQWAAWDWDWRSCRRLSGCMAAQCALNRAQIRERLFW